MTNVMLCLGRQATHPFDWEQVDARVYNIEELCFYIVRGRFMLGIEAFTPAMCDWIEKECGLEELAISVRRRLDAGSSVLEIATVILEYVRYNTQEEIEEARLVLKESGDMDVYEKHLARADFLSKSSHYDQAYDVYEGLRRLAPESDEAMRTRILRGEGAMNARMLSFVRASECYRAAYDLSHEPEDYLKYLAAVRLSMSEKEYLDYIAQDARGYQYSMTLEAEISAAEEHYPQSEGYTKIKELIRLKREGRLSDYYEMCAEITKELKRGYRGQDDVVVKGRNG